VAHPAFNKVEVSLNVDNVENNIWMQQYVLNFTFSLCLKKMLLLMFEFPARYKF
jgi:hypothetical protein